MKEIYTPEQLRHIEELEDKYNRLFLQELDYAKRTAVELTKNQTIAAYKKECHSKRLNKLKNNISAIITDGDYLTEYVIEEQYNIMKNYPRDVVENFLQTTGRYIEKDNEIYINASYITVLIEHELEYHIKSLENNKTALQKLFSNAAETIEASKYTARDEKSTKDSLSESVRFRRGPLEKTSTYGLMGDKAVASLLQEEDIFSQRADGQITLQWVVDQASKKSEPVPTYFALTYEGEDGKITKRLTAYDREVYNAIGTVYYYWHEVNPTKALYITPQEIWRTMNGKLNIGSKAKPSKAQVKKICASLDKMRFTRFSADIREEIKAFNLFIDDERIVGGWIETYILNSSKIEFTTDKGNTVQGYRIGEEPILYTYNKAKKRIMYVPYDLLDTSKYISDSENVTEFKGYLLQQILLMKNAIEQKGKGKYFKRNNIILLETLYSVTGIKPPEERITGEYANKDTKQQLIRRSRKADRQKIEGIMDSWIDKGWIKGYTAINQKNEPLKAKQQAKGYRIKI